MNKHENALLRYTDEWNNNIFVRMLRVHTAGVAMMMTWPPVDYFEWAHLHPI